MGVESSIIARNNSFLLADGIPTDRIIYNWGGTGIDEAGNWVNGKATSVLDAYNASHPETPLSPAVTGKQGPHLQIEPAPAARAKVELEAGAGIINR